MTKATRTERVFEGIAAAPGIAHGEAFVLARRELEIPNYQVEKSKISGETARFDLAILQTRQQIQSLQDEVEKTLGPDEARIFDAHLLVLEDQALVGETLRELEFTGENIESCFHRVAQRYVAVFDQIDDEYLRERASDLRDVTQRVLRNLLGHSVESLGKMVRDRIVVAHNLAPSDSASMERGKVLALATDAGSVTGHAVIMARSMGVPAVVAARRLTAEIQNGDWLLVDGFEGLVILNPSEQTLFRYGKLQRQRKSLETRVRAENHLPTQMLCGHRVTLRTNIEGTDDLWKLEEFQCDGIGLFRTEYLFLGSTRLPTEEEQYGAYRRVAEAVAPNPVVIRTLDIGGDKPLGIGQPIQEANPFLGLRGIRYTLENKDLFRTQLRAILRASAHGRIHIMFPMISGVGEVLRAQELLDDCRADLQARGQPFDPKIEIGSMIEVPSAALTIDLLARRCSFFSIGTNDLIQYLLAIDRVNDRISDLYEPAHPGVLRMLRLIVEGSHAHRLPVAVCGEMAADPLYAPLLIGLGVDELSVAPGMLPMIKYLIRRFSLDDARLLATKALEAGDARKARKVCEAFYHQRVSEMEIVP